SPSESPKDKSGLDASAKLTRAELNKRSGDADLSKDKSVPGSPSEFRRSWYVEGHIMSGVVSSVLAQQHLRNSPIKGDEGPSFGGPKLNLTFITAEVTFTEHKQPTSLAKGFSDRFSLESSGTSDTHRQTRSTSKSQKTPSKNKEQTHLRRSRRLEDRSTTKEKTQRERSKSRGKRRAKLPRNIRVYEGNKDPEDHLGIFSAAAEQEEWPMPVWCKMFCQTLGGAARNCFDDLDPKSVDSFEELSQNFLEEFSQKKRYAKDTTEIHSIKRRQNEGLQAFIDRFKSESSHIKGVPLVLRISAFMHGHGDKGYVRPTWYGVPEKAINRGGPREARRNIGVYTPYPRKDTFTPLIKTTKDILAMKSVSFPELPPLIRTPEKQNLNKFCDHHGDRCHNTNDCYRLKKQIEEALASGKFAHLVKDKLTSLYASAFLNSDNSRKEEKKKKKIE
ncbi:reverse transcriptase domain-containing protein, partial [Tanacetum coccineum]